MSDCEKHPAWDAWTGIGVCPECFAELERVSSERVRQLAEATSLFEASSVFEERQLALDLLDARRERDEARKALRWLAGAYAGMRDQPEAPKYVIATVRAAIAAARAAAKGGGDA